MPTRSSTQRVQRSFQASSKAAAASDRPRSRRRTTPSTAHCLATVRARAAHEAQTTTRHHARYHLRYHARYHVPCCIKKNCNLSVFQISNRHTRSFWSKIWYTDALCRRLTEFRCFGSFRLISGTLYFPLWDSSAAKKTIFGNLTGCTVSCTKSRRVPAPARRTAHWQSPNGARRNLGDTRRAHAFLSKCLCLN